ncbi:MAG TPA: hypothetical protein DCE00_00485 [Firmicutes bacterium]|jgi:V/A-type H+-transporting ATPase subunit I|nr:V-type ATP synthase subunit I [Bacillota bacterium]HAA37326.1 hypothetical protein [Bacillota bacterium]
MGIAKMSKVTLLAHQTDKERILDLLQQSGVLEISDLTEQLAAEEPLADFLEQDQEQEAMQAVEKSMAEVRFNLDFLNRYHRVNKGLLDDLLAEKKALTVSEVEENVPTWAEISSKVYQTFKAIDEQLLALRNEETRLQNLRKQLQPWQKLTLPLEDLKDSKTVRLQLAAVPAAQLAGLEAELAASGAAYYLELIDSQRGESFILLAAYTADEEAVQDVIKQFDFNRHLLPALTGTAAENLAKLEQELLDVQTAQEEALARIAEQVQFREVLLYYYDYLSVQRDQKQSVELLARTESTFLLEGWVPTAEVEGLRQKVSALNDSIQISVREPYEDEDFPVQFENKPFFAPYEFVTKLYGAPNPRSVDPTAPFTPFFVIFFGLCLTDAGYGVILMLLGLLGLRKVKGESMRNLLKILVACGFSTVVCGWLIGGWFGYPLFGAPLLFDALSDPMRLLVYSLALGILHIFWGMAVKCISLVREGKIFDALADVGLWYGLIIGLLLLALPSTAAIGKNMALVSTVGLILTQGRSQPTLLKKIFSGVLSLYDITGYFSDLLSYSRLLALGLATGVVSLTVNTMADLLSGHPIGYVAMAVLLVGGHTFNLAINALGSFIHSARLQYIEFYNRFYEGGGRIFRPFRYNTSHIEILGEGAQEK